MHHVYDWGLKMCWMLFLPQKTLPKPCLNLDFKLFALMFASLQSSSSLLLLLYCNVSLHVIAANCRCVDGDPHVKTLLHSATSGQKHHRVPHSMKKIKKCSCSYLIHYLSERKWRSNYFDNQLITTITNYFRQNYQISAASSSENIMICCFKLLFYILLDNISLGVWPKVG